MIKKFKKSIDFWANIYYNIVVPREWAFSSVGQSTRLITGWSGVRVPDGPRMAIRHETINIAMAVKLRQDTPEEVRRLSAAVQCRNGMTTAWPWRLPEVADKRGCKKMYIPEFWCGVAATIITEVIIAIAYSIYADHKKGGKK